MALQILPKESAVRADTNAKLLLERLVEKQTQLHLDEAIVFYNFPLFREEEKLFVADLVLVSAVHGVILISTGNAYSVEAEERLEGAYSQIFSRLVKYRKLRRGKAELAVNLESFFWTPEGQSSDVVKVGFKELEDHLSSLVAARISDEILEELISVLDGSKALIRAPERNTENFSSQSRIAIIKHLEEEIRKFDLEQRRAYMTEVDGPQRIRGLAGSGKTVVLALKAALTAIRQPEAKIAVTFYTKSLYQHIKQLITRFYRLHEDRDPDWEKLQVLHAWGGATVDGLYYKVAQRFGHRPLNYGQAQALSRSQPFGAACQILLNDPSVHSAFDYVFVDEAQDFPPEFMRLALRLATEEKLVIAYDVFQTIFDLEVPTAASLFGTDEENAPAITFDEDIFLHKCYRNPREILVCSHAIGFGIYGRRIVQMLESREHWEDFGYEVHGNLTAGQEVSITRPEENSPSSISSSCDLDEIISARVFTRPADEIAHVAAKIRDEIQKQGVPAEEILVVCADDRNAANYLSSIKTALNEFEIRSNNLQDDTFSLRDFQKVGAVTLSTVYKAKGNEAYSVYLVGIDALFHQPTPQTRNKAFTGMTRAKGWLHVTGIGPAGQVFVDELRAAKKNFPELKFIYPSEQQLVYMKRDLVQVDPEEIYTEWSKLESGLDPEDYERFLRRKLRETMAKRRAKKKMA